MPFKTGGPFDSNDFDSYITRRSEKEVLDHIRQMNYILLTEPHQQGKTNLLNYLRFRANLPNVNFVYIYLTTINNASISAWFEDISNRILSQLEDIDVSIQPTIPENETQWRQFLLDLSNLAQSYNKNFVIALDQIAHSLVADKLGFFTVLRDIYNSRGAQPAFKHITFILCGTFRPQTLISDPDISPFNIAQRVQLPDFTLDQIIEFVSRENWELFDPRDIAQYIYHWTSGQPYLTQLLGKMLFDRSIEIRSPITPLVIEDRNHIPYVLEPLFQDSKLLSYVRRLVNNHKDPYFPTLDAIQDSLELLGVIKADHEGNCALRNLIYTHVISVRLKLANKNQEDSILKNLGTRWGLFVGINRYDDKIYQELGVCVNDVETIRERLVQVGYNEEKLFLLTDNTSEQPVRRNIYTMLSRIVRALEPHDTLLVYYSGHGDTINGESYLISKDSDRSMLEDTGVSVSRIKKILEDAPAKVKILFIDACHSGENIGQKSGTAMSDEFFKDVFANAEGLAILASCKQGQVSWVMNESQSVFTHFMLRAITGEADRDHKGWITLQDAYHFMLHEIQKWSRETGREQEPTLHYKMKGEIILSRY